LEAPENNILPFRNSYQHAARTFWTAKFSKNRRILACNKKVQQTLKGLIGWWSGAKWQSDRSRKARRAEIETKTLWAFNLHFEYLSMSLEGSGKLNSREEKN